MNSKLFSKSGLILLAAGVVILTATVNYLLRGARVDLTQDDIYTLSSGTVNIMKNLPEPVTLKFYFSRSQTGDIPQIRNYARRVQELLQEYVQLSNGRIELEVIDPEPFSEHEDEAAGYGLQAVPVSRAGQTVYMGLVALGADVKEGADRKTETIRFLSPDKERFLEYDVSNLIYGVSHTSKPKLALISSLPVNGGGFDMATRQLQQPWMSISQLEKLYTVQTLAGDVKQIPDDISLLILVLPELSLATRYAVDQYVLRGGNALIFLDPFAESAGGVEMMGQGGTQSAYLEDLLNTWGVEMVKDHFVADDKFALSVGSAMGRPIRHLGILGYGKSSFNGADVVTSNLKTVNFSSAGALKLKEGAAVTFEPLLQSSTESALLNTTQLTMMSDPKVLQKGFQPTGEQYTIAARITGQMKTAFPDGQPEPVKSDEGKGGNQSSEPEAPLPAHIQASKKTANIILVADTDVLSNRLWVQVSQFFGQQVANPFANNGDMFTNMADNLTGNADLISIRSRGQFSRPFTRVDELERQAQARFLKTEEELNQQLQSTERRLMELQMKKQGKDAFVMSAEQTQEVEKFKQEKLKIRKQLRDVQHQLNLDIDRLGTQLKWINILLVPMLLTLVALFWRGRRLRIA
ncbi:Gldg family protein [Sansalvadorimonas verongulae]|uniref:Gldg family protein n=1 Tax=Sansalvadorimonas verongulae TaxID=2172824 RepID=UPI0012BD373B|nr:Gldg family protein [Sansalvadorimonas verongulae]MTI12898.1 ABC transporter [Sansalvadorimonas verongulae]